MFTFEVDGRKVEAKVTFYTAHLYEMEFQGDLIRDLYGVQDNATDLMELEKVGEDDYRVKRIDFTKVHWSAVMKVLWSAVKTANQATPSYTDWMRSTSGVNLLLVQDMLGDEVSDCFFRPEAAQEEAEEEER